MGKPPTSGCNCNCSDGYIPPATSGRCCYYVRESGAWTCLDYVTESYCNSLYFGKFAINEVCSGYSCENSCFISGTSITTGDFKHKYITDLTQGDKVASPNGGVNNVLGVVRSKLGQRKLISIDGNRAFVTEDHPFVTTKGLKSFNADMTRSRYPSLKIEGELASGDHILTCDGSYILKKYQAEDAESDTDVFTLNLDGDHLFFANGLGVHNKQEPPPPSPSGAPYSSGVMAYWKLNEATGIRYDSKNGYDLSTSYNSYGPLGTAAKINNGTETGRAGTFPLTNTVTAGSTIDFDPNTSFTIDGWFLANNGASAGSYCLIELSETVARYGVYWDQSSGKVSFVIFNDPLFPIVTHPTVVATNTLTYFVCSYNNQTNEISININNGTPQTTTANVSSGPTYSPFDKTLGMGYPPSLGGANALSGVLDEVGIYSGVFNGVYRWNGGAGNTYPFT